MSPSARMEGRTVKDAAASWVPQETGSLQGSPWCVSQLTHRRSWVSSFGTAWVLRETTVGLSGETRW